MKIKASLLLICAGACAFAAEHNWSTGHVLDANTTRNIVHAGTTFQSNTYGSATATTNGSVYGNQYSSTTEVSGRSSTVGSAHDHHEVVQDNRVVIESEEYRYTVNDESLKAVGLPTYGLVSRAIANRKHGCRMVIGDDIQYEQVKSKLFVQDADGKVCKLDILRQERIASPSAENE